MDGEFPQRTEKTDFLGSERAFMVDSPYKERSRVMTERNMDFGLILRRSLITIIRCDAVDLQPWSRLRRVLENHGKTEHSPHEIR